MATQSPYTRPAPMLLKCVANKTTTKAVSFKRLGETIVMESSICKTSSAFSNGETIYICTMTTETPQFEEGVTYFLKNVTLSHRYGRQNIFFGRTSVKFRAAPLTLTSEVENAAREALCPPSNVITETADIFSSGDFPQKVACKCLYDCSSYNFLPSLLCSNLADPSTEDDRGAGPTSPNPRLKSEVWRKCTQCLTLEGHCPTGA